MDKNPHDGLGIVYHGGSYLHECDGFDLWPGALRFNHARNGVLLFLVHPEKLSSPETTCAFRDRIADVNGYRTVESGKQFAIWIAIRGFGLMFYLSVDLIAIRKGQTLLIVVFSCFVISFALHFVDLLLRLARMGELQKVSR